MQVVHWLAVDKFLLAATLETAAIVHGCGGRVAAVRHLHTGERGMREMSFTKAMLKYYAELHTWLHERHFSGDIYQCKTMGRI